MSYQNEKYKHKICLQRKKIEKMKNNKKYTKLFFEIYYKIKMIN